MKVVKYLGKKRGGMPVHFPVGCQSKSAIIGHKVAAPYLALTDEEAETLLAGDRERIRLSGKRVIEKKDKGNNVISRTEVFDAPDPSATPLWALAPEDEAHAFLASSGKLPPKQASGLDSLTDDELEAETKRRKAAAKKAKAEAPPVEETEEAGEDEPAEEPEEALEEAEEEAKPAKKRTSPKKKPA